MTEMILINSGEGIAVSASTVLTIYPCVSVSTLPSLVFENDIAVITTDEITNWCIQAEEPTSPVEGTLWIVTRDGGYAWFNIGMPSAPIIVHPATALQYIDSTWVSKDAYVYQNNDWMQFQYYLYNAGDEYNILTEGWTVYNGSNGTGVKNADNITLGYKSSSGRTSSVWTNGLIDVTNFSKLCVLKNITAVTNQLNIGLGSTNNTHGTVPDIVNKTFTTTGLSTGVVDISEYSGLYYVGLYANITNATIYKVWLE